MEPPTKVLKTASSAGNSQSDAALAMLGLENCQHKYRLGSSQLGTLHDSSMEARLGNFTKLRENLERDGYIYVRGLLPKKQVETARHAVLKHLRDQGLLAANAPWEEGMIGATPDSDQGRLTGAEALCRGPEILDCLEHDALREFFSKLFGGCDVLTYDYKWLRTVKQGESTGFHMDTVYMGPETSSLLTCWIPVMAVPLDLGGLAVCRGSHREEGFSQVRETYGALNLDTGDVGGTGWFSEDPDEVASYGGHWETAEFEAGDVVVFGMHTMHGSCVNQTGRWRISFDVRWQPKHEAVDQRWMLNANGDCPGLQGRWNLHRNDRREFPRTIEMAKRDWGLSPTSKLE